MPDRNFVSEPNDSKVTPLATRKQAKLLVEVVYSEEAFRACYVLVTNSRVRSFRLWSFARTGMT